MPINFVLKLDILFTIWRGCLQDLSNCEHCPKLNKVTKHSWPAVNLQYVCCSQKNIIFNEKIKPRSWSPHLNVTEGEGPVPWGWAVLCPGVSMCNSADGTVRCRVSRGFRPTDRSVCQWRVYCVGRPPQTSASQPSSSSLCPTTNHTGHLTRDMWHMTLDTWHLIYDTWHMARDTWHVILETWHVTCHTWNMTLDAWHMTFNTRHMTRHMTHDTWHMTLDTWHLIHDIWHSCHTWNMTLDTCHMTIDMGHLIHDTWHMTCEHVSLDTRDTWYTHHLIQCYLTNRSLDAFHLTNTSFDTWHA